MALKILGTGVGAMLALGGLIAGGAGVATLATIGSDGTIASGQQTFATSGAALVTSPADVDGIDDAGHIVGDARVRVSLRSASAKRGLFVGVGPAQQVERYLAAAPIDEVTDFEVDPFTLTRHARGGTARPAPPASQDFWVAQSSGRPDATLRWKLHSGEYRMVVMNADGSRGVNARGDLAFTIPHTAAIAWSLIGGGLLLLLGGVATILSARASTPRLRRLADPGSVA
jgi:hypothetical protein